MTLFLINETASGTSGRKYGWTLERDGATYNAFDYKGSVELPYPATPLGYIAAKAGKSAFKAGGDTPLLIRQGLDVLTINIIVIALGYVPEVVKTFEGELLTPDLELATEKLNLLKTQRESRVAELWNPLNTRESQLSSVLTKGIKKKKDVEELEVVSEKKTQTWKQISKEYHAAKQQVLNELSKVAGRFQKA